MLYAQEKQTILITKKSKDQLYKFPCAMYWCKQSLENSIGRATFGVRTHAFLLLAVIHHMRLY